MQAKSERFEMRLDQGILDRVDAWRAKQDDLPSRAEAIRRLVENGLDRSLSMTGAEKLIMTMLSDISTHLKVDGDLDPDLIKSAISGGHLWGLGWEYSSLIHGDIAKEGVVSEVRDILNMWRFIERGYDALTQSEKERVAAEADPYGKNVVFPGFDGNEETEYMSVAIFMIEELGRFPEFKDSDLNSHYPSLERYRRMYAVFEPMQPTLIGVELNASQIIEILMAHIHPSRR